MLLWTVLLLTGRLSGELLRFRDCHVADNRPCNLYLFPLLYFLNSFIAEEMDQADEELRGTIQQIWPFQAKKMLDLLMPRREQLNRNNLTIGKIYAGSMILESWRNTRFGKIESGIPVTVSE